MQEDPLIGTHLGHFKVERVIAVGGMGVIYQATHSVIGRTAAIKVLSEKYSSDRNMIKRLHREARAVNQIGHPNIIDIFDFGQTPDHREYFVMEYLPGKSLAQLLEQHGRLPWRLIAPITTQVLDALAAAHDQGIIHRDMKPENILVIQQDNGDINTKILDFGIAKSVGLGPEGERLTRAGVVLGTPEYIAPEQIRGKEVDGRADLYGVGVMLYEMVMGSRPFDADQVVSLLMLHLKEPVPRMDLPAEAGVPDYVPAVITRALAKNPNQRFPDARTFARALELDTSAAAPADGTRPLPELMWEKPEGSDPRSMGYQATEPGVGPPMDPARVPTAPMGSPGPTTLPGAGPQPLQGAFPPTAPGPSMPTGSLEPASRRSPLIYIIPLALVLAAGAGVGAWFALKPDAGPTTQPVARTQPDAAPTETREELDIQALFEKVRRTLRSGVTHKLADVRMCCIRGMGILREDLPLLSKLLLEEPEQEVRRTVALAIAEMGEEAGVVALREARSRSGDLMKVWIDEALLRMGKAEGRIGLKAALRSEEKKVRFTAAAALAEARDTSAIPVLTEMAKEPVMARSAAFVTVSGTLAQLGHRESYKALEGALEQKHPLLKLNAAKAMARLGSDRGLETLKSILRDGKRETRLAAAEALASLGDYSGLETLGDAAKAKDVQTRKTAAIGLGYVTDRAALPSLAKTLQDPEWTVKASSAESLARILSQMPSALVRRSQDWIKLTFLHNRDWSVRYAAVGIADDMDPELAVRLLGYAYADADPRVRRAAIASLGKLRSKKSIDILRRSLTTDEDEEVRAEAARSLAKVGADPEAKKALHSTALHDTPTVGIPAAGALLALGDEKYLPELKRATRSPAPRIRRAAIRALARWKSPRAIPVLEKGLRDRSPRVRLAAALALAARGDRSAEEELQAAVKRGGRDEDRATAALAKLGIKPTKDIEQLARSGDTAERRRAMALAPLVPPRTGLGVLRRGAADRSPRVRLAAATALSRMAGKERRTVPLLKRLARDPDPLVRARASVALADAAKTHSALSREDPGTVKPVVEAAPREGTFRLKKKPKKEDARKETPDWVPVKDPPREKRYKMAMGFATAALGRGRYNAALRHLRSARRAKDTAAVRCDLGEIYHKKALRQYKHHRQRARKNLESADRNYRECGRRARGRKLKIKAARGKRDVHRLRQLIR